NDYLVRKTGAKVYAPPFESTIMGTPSIEPFFLFGAKPIPELTERFVMGRRSVADVVLSDGHLELEERRLTILPLPGHSPNQIGVLVEAVCFPGDALFSEAAWDKHVVVYLADVGKTLESLESLRTVGAREFVPSHTEPTSDIAQLIDLNVSRVQRVADEILHILRAPTTAEEVLKAIADRHALAITTPQQYYLTFSAVKAYLSSLAEREIVRYFTDENRLFWQATE
ncbi:MAG: MBL fold metallo-hydrolase, partial [Chloroflexi bacterium]|nr:MBL fold metallo-hydrolase [Chloroflexota bacterium]